MWSSMVSNLQNRPLWLENTINEKYLIITIYLLRNSSMNIKLFSFLISVYFVALLLSIVYYTDYHATSSQVYQPTWLIIIKRM